MSLEEWILCPVCGKKTRVRIRKDTELRSFPLYCPKCSRESLIEVRNLKITVIKEPDALRRAEKLMIFHSLSTLFFNYDNLEKKADLF